MNKSKIVIASATAVMLSLSGILAYNVITDHQHKINDPGTASAMTVPTDDILHNNQEEENSGNYTYIPPVFEYDDNKSNEDVSDMDENIPTTTPWTPATEMDLEPSSLTVFVNKEYALPEDYVPENLVIPNVLFDLAGYDERKLLRKDAAAALEQLFAAAQADGYTLYGVSGYRSYTRQTSIFKNNIVKKGKKHTLKYSAVPGTSEHQTGLAIDVSTKQMKFRLVTTFANSPEGKWLAENAHFFGYIIRYPKNRTDVTGYAYEPWHIRYVGKDLANYLYTNNMTLEDYYHYTPSKDFDFEKKYAELINYVPPVTPTPTPEMTPTPVPGDLDGDGFVDDLDGDGIADCTDELPEDLDGGDENNEGSVEDETETGENTDTDENTEVPGKDASEDTDPESSLPVTTPGAISPSDDADTTGEDPIIDTEDTSLEATDSEISFS